MAKSKPRKATATEILREAILNCGLNQTELAELTGVEQASISRFVRGQRDLSLANIELLLPVIGVEVVARKPRSKSGD